MDLKNINYRLEIIKLAIKLNDEETIKLQTKNLLQEKDKKILEIASLLQKGGLKQASYLIKKFQEESDFEDTVLSVDEDKEYTLSIDDMLKMSPIAKETIKEYKSKGYTKEDLKAFAKNISASVAKDDNNDNSFDKDNNLEVFKEIEHKIEIDSKQEDKEEEINKPLSEDEEAEQNDKQLQSDNNIETAINNAHKDTPLDEISAEVTQQDKTKKRAKVINTYKTLRAKFAKDKEQYKEEKKSLKEKFLSKTKEVTQKIKQDTKQQPQESAKKVESKEEVKNEIYAPIPHIEHKFRQLFTLYPPIKESDIWVEEVVKFLKFVSANSYSEDDIKKFFEEYLFYLEKGDIARASQVLLLAAATDSKYARFILARELFKGKVLKRDFKKSYGIMKQLANSGYADAICDLAQFYEYGIEVPKDTKIALKLYEKAFELGVNRATKHINRIKESSGLLKTIKKFIG